MKHSMAQSHQRSRGSRGGGSCGFILVTIGIFVLGRNEGNSVKYQRALQQLQDQCIPLESVQTIDAKNEDQLIYVSGMLEPETPLVDAMFQVYPETPALQLRRAIKMYQWVEVQDYYYQEASNDTDALSHNVYSYDEHWVDHVVDSSLFNQSATHANPSNMLFQELVQVTSQPKIGVFNIDKSHVVSSRTFTDEEPLLSSNYSVTNLPPETVGQNHVTAYSERGYYFGSNPSTPAIGDTIVTFSFLPRRIVSVIARQSGNSLTTFVSLSGQEVFWLQDGTVPAETMFLEAKNQVTVMTWVFRFVGFLIVMGGFKSVLAGVAVPTYSLPLVGNCLHAVADFVAFLLAALVSSLVIAIAWLIYRPFLLVILLTSVGCLSYYIWKKCRSSRNDDAECASQEAKQDDVEMLHCHISSSGPKTEHEKLCRA